MNPQDPRLKPIWNQTRVPIVQRLRHPPLRIRMPRSRKSAAWIRHGRRNKPRWDERTGCWKAPVAWYPDLVERSLREHGEVYVIQRYRRMQKCAPACWNAKGYECECSCGGQNHGTGRPDGRWFVVSDTFAFRWEGVEYVCRHLTVRAGSSA